MFQLVPIITPGWWKLPNQHISLKYLPHLYILVQDFSTQVLVNMNLFHDCLSSIIWKRSHSSATYFFYSASLAPYLTSNLSQMILSDLKVINKSNRGLVICFNKCPLTAWLSFSNFFFVSSSTVLNLSLTIPSPETAVVSEVLFFSVRSENNVHNQPLVVQRI